MTPEQEALIDRVRGLLAGETRLREVSMFGGRSFMVDEKLAVCAMKDGSLLVRVPGDRHDELLARPGAEQAEMGTGRTMGPGWIDVQSDGIDDDADLAAWVEIALAYNRTLER